MGNQGTAAQRPAQGGRADPGRRARARSREVHVWTNRPSLAAGAGRHDPAGGEDPVPQARPLGRLSSARPRCGRYARQPRQLPPASTGAAGGTSAPAPSATWPATPPTWRSWRLKLGYPTSVVGRGRRRQPRDVPGWAHVDVRVPGPRRHARRARCTGTRASKDGKKVPPPEELLAKAA